MIAIVTGASKGIGKSTVLRLKAEGYTVIATSRTKPDVGDENYQLDVSNKDSVFSFVEKIINKYGKIDVVVNNAGFGVYGSFLETDLNEEEYMVKTNFLGPLYFMKAVLPYMVKWKSGSIVNIISEAAYVNTPRLLVYSATKSALASLTNGLWAEMRKYNVKVSGIYPGPVKTNFTSHPSFSKLKSDPFAKYSVDPEIVANAVIKAIKTGKREIYVPSKIRIEPYFLKLSNIMQNLTYFIVSKYFS
ncbi:SDR family NAD(P)-dependent oxidoreductase [Acidianus sulfidivorans JP7]|uniref:3-oxoacyl-ACP reductase n=1 Tax=Acidianus sulfidivorans JP7 TaxID=619593 RepID=A0A2U9INS7_9CREN|nr:SDR family NAD(P)-dependent oxidoreductase [Acidianus sulfidivorans]AWR97680.1 SDR family NAD(P)-dependent oxidoreductase [Acidianus sulfidivorans JP7]